MSDARPLSIRVEEKERQLKLAIEKAKQLEAQLKALESRKKEEERKARTHRLIEIGATLESITKQPIQKANLPMLLEYLTKIEENNFAFSKAIGLNPIEEVLENDESSFEDISNFIEGSSENPGTL